MLNRRIPIEYKLVYFALAFGFGWFSGEVMKSNMIVGTFVFIGLIGSLIVGGIAFSDRYLETHQ